MRRKAAAVLFIFVMVAANSVISAAGEGGGAGTATGPSVPPEALQPGAAPAAPSAGVSMEEKALDRVLPPQEVDAQVRRNQEAEATAAGAQAGAPDQQDAILAGEEQVPPDLSARVKKFIRYFRTAGRKKFELWLSRSGKYTELMRGILAKYGLPGDLVYLALIESGFSPNAYSVARAVGPWQFIAGTAKRYGLRIDWWIDERRDYEKSTHAAAAYLKDLYSLFESWDLAAAAYNAGEGKIINALMKYRTEEYADLIRGRYLAQETKDYVPKLYAALSIAKQPDRYGFGDVKIEAPLAFDKVEVPGGTDLASLAAIVGLSADAVREWNPELRRFCTPPNQETYELRLPQGLGAVARERMDEIRANAKITFLLHPIRKGETVTSLSRKYGVPAEVLREINGLRKDSIRGARQLVIPLTGLSPEEAVPGKELSPEQLEAVLARAGAGGLRAHTGARVMVRRGDTLARLARRAGVSVEELARANGLAPGARIRAGQRLRLPERRQGLAAADAGGKKGIRYVVRSGDTLWKIARSYGVDVERLAEWNNLAPGRPLRQGRVLVVSPES